MKPQDLKYLMSFSIPFSCYFSIEYNGIWSWTTIIYAFGMIPLIELILGAGHGGQEELTEEREHSIYFDFLLYLNLPVLYYFLYSGFNLFYTNTLSSADTWGKLLSIGITLGASGINVAHELGHKSSLVAQITSKLLLIPSLYTHFTVQHNRGHHLNVGTPIDPATAKKGDIVYLFWWRSIINAYIQAWALENKRLQKLNKPILSLRNEMIVNTIVSFMYLGSIYYFYNTYVLCIGIAIAIISFLLLETINYIEHYGLSRKLMDNGKYERVELFHSWNSNHILGRIVLYELTRHADHHYKANKKYQTLLHYDESPQLPYGYPTSLLIALVPPMWFSLIHPILDRMEANKI